MTGKIHLAAGCAALIALAGCATTGDAAGAGDERLEDTSRADGDGASAGQEACPEGAGNLLLLDARTAEPLACALVSLTRQAHPCGDDECPQAPLLEGRTTSSGHLSVPDEALETARIHAVAEGFAESARDPAPAAQGTAAELELVPADGYLLKFVDPEGNYLAGVDVRFTQGSEVIAQKRTNDLANVWFPSRTPFAGEPVLIEAEGYPPLTVAGQEELGEDGHTVTLKK